MAGHLQFLGDEVSTCAMPRLRQASPQARQKHFTRPLRAADGVLRRRVFRPSFQESPASLARPAGFEPATPEVIRPGALPLSYGRSREEEWVRTTGQCKRTCTALPLSYFPMAGPPPRRGSRARRCVDRQQAHDLFDERQPGRCLSNRAAVICRRNADRHGLVCPRPLVLDDELVGQAVFAQSFGDLTERALRRDRQSNHDGSFGERSACRFTCGVGGLSDLNSSREVVSHDDVVDERSEALLDSRGWNSGVVDRRSRRTLTVNPSASSLDSIAAPVKGSKNHPGNRHKDG